MTPEAALADVAGIGPFFAVTTDPHPDWPPLSALLAGPGLAGQVAATRAALAGPAGRPVELRVAASVTQLGLAARLLSPLLAVAVLHRLVLRLDPDEVRCRPGLGGPIPLAVTPGSITTVHSVSTMDETADRLAAEVLAPLIAPLAGRSGLRWGNAASAVAGAAATVAAARPDHAPAARALTAALLDRPPLAGTGDLTAGRFRRRSCCLLYRAGSPLCGDCALPRPPG